MGTRGQSNGRVAVEELMACALRRLVAGESQVQSQSRQFPIEAIFRSLQIRSNGARETIRPLISGLSKPHCREPPASPERVRGRRCFEAGGSNRSCLCPYLEGTVESLLAPPHCL